MKFENLTDLQIKELLVEELCLSTKEREYPNYFGVPLSLIKEAFCNRFRTDETDEEVDKFMEVLGNSNEELRKLMKEAAVKVIEVPRGFMFFLKSTNEGETMRDKIDAWLKLSKDDPISIIEKIKTITDMISSMNSDGKMQLQTIRIMNRCYDKALGHVARFSSSELLRIVTTERVSEIKKSFPKGFVNMVDDMMEK